MLNGTKEQALLLKNLGKHTAGKGCLYIDKLADVDAAVLSALIERSWKHMEAKHPF